MRSMIVPRTERITISLPRGLLEELTAALGSAPANRSALIQESLRFYTRELRHRRMAEEAAKLDAVEEVALAEEALATDLGSWPEY
jgi:metal-responsive CopG/Arc/MetJ family transcriptional regulator